jgi:hypothetical protein
MTVDNQENLIINIGGRTQLFNKEFVRDALKAHTIEKEHEKLTFCARYNRDSEKLAKEENKIEPNYYMKYKIIPLDFILANNISFVEANVIKYVCRWRDKNGIEDLKKAVSYLEKLIKYEENGTK